MPVLRREKFNYHGNKVKKYPKTNRTELSHVARAFAMGSLITLRGNITSQHQLATKMGRAQSSLSELLSRTEKKAAEKTVALWDEILYKNDLGRGRSKLLTKDQKERIVSLVISTHDNREKESWQAIADGDFDEIVPRMSVTTFENIMYEYGYACHCPSWKPHLTPEQEKEQYVWALEHNPDKDEEYDNKGFNFYGIAYTDEMPAQIGKERGMCRTWCKGDERWDDNVKHNRNCKDCCLQFYGAFRYNYKGPCCNDTGQ
ncbi:hypothetical protein BU25DRAFT_494728 [Macroventuria anomochaeta]|uniref:Uncharacterized protein n=1 Tax=Macroventuria anomochaeta TaxID=301207 RepID=A0ACB6RM43_9PLEO|nr:uncharacterized protein BU25DRAFT_494728 [Macroventuria anomochaeta]KAF2622863.1 hypothetical protein BU25DRAFT_494728 [Macroventuria anomochaeta]